jgi:hypothetical protein
MERALGKPVNRAVTLAINQAGIDAAGFPAQTLPHGEPEDSFKKPERIWRNA